MKMDSSLIPKTQKLSLYLELSATSSKFTYLGLTWGSNLTWYKSECQYLNVWSYTHVVCSGYISPRQGSGRRSLVFTLNVNFRPLSSNPKAHLPSPFFIKYFIFFLRTECSLLDCCWLSVNHILILHLWNCVLTVLIRPGYLPNLLPGTYLQIINTVLTNRRFRMGAL